MQDGRDESRRRPVSMSLDVVERADSVDRAAAKRREAGVRGGRRRV
jgi:hypothetical protein